MKKRDGYSELMNVAAKLVTSRFLCSTDPGDYRTKTLSTNKIAVEMMRIEDVLRELGILVRTSADELDKEIRALRERNKELEKKLLDSGQ